MQCELCERPPRMANRCDEHWRCDECGESGRGIGLCNYGDGVRCQACQDDLIAARIAAFDGDTECTSDVICPWCGHKHRDSWEFGEGRHECGMCERSFELTKYVDVNFTTKRAE